MTRRERREKIRARNKSSYIPPFKRKERKMLIEADGDTMPVKKRKQVRSW